MGSSTYLLSLSLVFCAAIIAMPDSESGAESKLTDAGYETVSDETIQKMPMQPITAVLNYHADARVAIPVNSPYACLNLARSMPKLRATAGARKDHTANCVTADGKIPVVVKSGQPYALKEIVPEY